ncbi:solute carrier family 22 member 7-like isoform X1 [Polypterus senegalus]|nr:solute carrier family 22 member 7-like isoform X1 [Polypterus senegalus]
MKYENLLDETGGFGRFQICIVILINLPGIITPWHFLLNNFIAAIPSHRCNFLAKENDSIFGNLTEDQKTVVHIPLEPSGSVSSCKMFLEPQFALLKNISSEAENASSATITDCHYGWTYDTSKFSSTIATEWDLVCDKKGLNQATATFFFIGVMLGAVVFGYLSDKFGRKTMLLVSYILSFIFGLASAFSVSYVMFVILRFLTGMSFVGISIISIVLCIEWVDIKHRTLVGVFGSMAWTTGCVLLALIAYLIRDWRWLLLAVTFPLLIACVIWCWIPESGRWYLVNGKMNEAHKCLIKCTQVNKGKNFRSRITPEMLATVVKLEEKSKNYTYWDLVRTPKLRRISACTGIVWFGVAFTYYGLSLNISGLGVSIYMTQFIYGAIEVPSKCFVYLILDRIGRRRCQAWTLIFTGTCIAINMFIPTGKQITRTVIAILGKFFSEASFSIVFLYTTELFPTVIRQNGMGFTSFMARLGVAVAPLVILLEDVWRLLPPIVFSSIAVLSALVAFLLPETQNIRLPETIEDVEQTRKVSTESTEQDVIALKPLNCDFKQN